MKSCIIRIFAILLIGLVPFSSVSAEMDFSSTTQESSNATEGGPRLRGSEMPADIDTAQMIINTSTLIGMTLILRPNIPAKYKVGMVAGVFVGASVLGAAMGSR